MHFNNHADAHSSSALPLLRPLSSLPNIAYCNCHRDTNAMPPAHPPHIRPSPLTPQKAKSGKLRCKKRLQMEM